MNVTNPTLKPYPAYKDSGVPWLGEIPAHWDVKRQRNIADMLVSNVDKLSVDGEVPVRLCNYVDVYKNDHITERIQFMRATASTAEIDRFRLRLGDVLITKDSESWNDIGVPSLVKYVADDLVCGYHLALLRPRPNVLLGSFLLRAIQSRGVSIQYHIAANGVTRYGLSQNAIKSVLVPIPSLEEQHHIAAFLTHIDHRVNRLIRIKRRMVALLNEQKQAIIHRAVTRGLDPDVRLKPSGVAWLGEVPEHWEVRRLKSLVTEAVAGPYGSSLTKAMYTKQGYRVYGQQQVIPDNFSVGDYYISAEKFAEMIRYHVTPNDVLVSVMGTVGRIAVVPESAEPGIINPRLVRYRPDFNKIRARYVQLAMQASPSQTQLAEGAKGTTMEGLNMQILGRLLILVPPLQEQDAILKNVDLGTQQLVSVINKAQREIDLIREYRTRLVADVVMGKLDVRGVDLAAYGDEPAGLDEALADEGDEDVEVADEVEEDAG